MTDETVRKPERWAAIHDIRIVDPDGWRRPYELDFETSITEEEFHERVTMSTIDASSHAARTFFQRMANR